MRTKFTKIQPNEKTDSNKLNSQYRNTAEDIADLYRNYIELKNDIEAHNVSLPATASAIESQISSLEATLASLDDGISVFTLYDNDPVVFPSSIGVNNRADYQQVLGEAVLPIASTDLEYHFINPLDGTRTLNDDVEKLVNSFITNNRFKPKINEIFENSNINAIDGTSNKAHVVKVRTRNSNITDLSLVYNLDTAEIRNINAVTVFPIPELACSFEDVILNKSTGVNAGVRDINGDEVTMPIANARKRVFRFPTTQVSGASVIINNTNFQVIDNIGTKEFVLGSRRIALEQITYINEGFIGLKVTVPTSKSQIGKITPQIRGEAENVDVFVYSNQNEFDAVGDSTIMSGTAQSIQNVINTTVTVDTIYILFKLTKQDNDTTPIIDGCVITWL